MPLCAESLDYRSQTREIDDFAIENIGIGGKSNICKISFVFHHGVTLVLLSTFVQSHCDRTAFRY